MDPTMDTDPSHNPPRSPTESLDDRYELVEILGVGGAAEVWRAHDRRLGRDVAVKVLSGPAARDPVHRRRIEREARALAAIAHPNVVGVYDYGEQSSAAGEPVPYIILELVDGPDLARHLRGRGPLDPDEAVALLLGILGGVEQAHRIGIVHGDLKPANVLLAADGPKVGDFGVARILAEETGTTVVTATPAYAPPEVLRGDRPEVSADVYSAACIAFELLTGRPPYEGRSVFELGRQHAEDPVPAPSGHRPDIPDRLDEAIRLGLAKEPSDRPPTAAAFADLLRAEVRGPAPSPYADATLEANRPGGPSVIPTVPIPRDPTEVLPRRPLRSFVPWIRRVPVGVTIALVAVLALVAMRQSATATTRAPSLLGLQREAAVAEAGERGFRTSVTEADQGGVAGTVVGQDPAPDALLRRGSTITLLVTKGAPQVVVPDLADRQVIDAVRTLEEARLTPGEVLFQIDREQTPGTVKRSDPPAGTSVDEGTTVDIVAYAVPTEDSEAGDDGENGPDDRRGRRGNRGDD